MMSGRLTREASSENVMARISVRELFDDDDFFDEELEVRGGLPGLVSPGFTDSKVISAVRSPLDVELGGREGCAPNERLAASAVAPIALRKIRFEGTNRFIIRSPFPIQAA